MSLPTTPIDWDDLPDVVFHVTPDGRWDALSGSVFTLTGKRRNAQLGRDCLADVLPDDRVAARRLLCIDVAPPSDGCTRDLSGQFRIRTMDQGVVTVEARVRQRWHADGAPLGVSGVMRHVISTGTLAGALAHSEARYRSLVTAMAEGVILLEADGTISTCNPAAERILGLSLSQLQGRTPIDPRWRSMRENGTVLSGEDHPAMVTLRTGAPLRDIVVSVDKPDGSRSWLNVNSQPLRDPSTDLPYGVVATFTDITETRRWHHLLHEARDVTEDPVDGTLGYWQYDSTEQQLTWDDTCVALVSGRPHTMPRTMNDWLDRIHPADQPSVIKSYQLWYESGFADAYGEAQYRIRTGADEWRWVEARRQVLEWKPDRTPARLTGSLRAVEAGPRATNQRLSLCAWCKRVRDRRGQWLMIEDYFAQYLETPFSHGMCGECAERLTGEASPTGE